MYHGTNMTATGDRGDCESLLTSDPLPLVTSVTAQVRIRLCDSSSLASIRLGASMKKLYWLGAALLSLAALSAAQDKVFDWVHASDESALLDPMDYHAGRVYHPAAEGGNLHVDIQARLPGTIALAPNDESTAVVQRPGQGPHLELL